jgi:hypothetical protein
MTKQSKIFIALFVIVLIGLSTYGYTVFRQRNLANNADQSQTENANQDLFQSAPEDAASNDVVTDNSAVDSPLDADGESTTVENNNFLDVSKVDCSNDCKNFTDPEDLKYCQQVCGLTPIKKDVKEKKGCDALKDLEKDYCLKDLAINKKDATICSQISDTDIKKVCKNRIAQDFLDAQK